MLPNLTERLRDSILPITEAMVAILNRLQKLLKAASNGDSDRKPPDVVDILNEDYQNLMRLAEQIRVHAERAPYPYVAQRLHQISLEKQKNASSLKEKIIDLGGKPKDLRLDIHSGKNHWARIVQDIKDQKELENRFLDDAFRLALELPEISDLLDKIVAGEVVHKETLQDLVARADPQADQC
ncbi:MAG: ferritin-like domain-containing protein [Candidatus Binatia bacterium]